MAPFRWDRAEGHPLQPQRGAEHLKTLVIWPRAPNYSQEISNCSRVPGIPALNHTYPHWGIVPSSRASSLWDDVSALGKDLSSFHHPSWSHILLIS